MSPAEALEVLLGHTGHGEYEDEIAWCESCKEVVEAEKVLRPLIPA